MTSVFTKRGRVGQILTSFPSLILVFFIMLTSVVVSGFLNTNPSSQTGYEPSPDAYALLNVFLDKTVITKEVGLEFNVNEMPMRQLLVAMAKLSGEKQKTIVEYVQKSFLKSYSCNGSNSLQVSRFNTKTDSELKFIDSTLPSAVSYPLVEQPAQKTKNLYALCLHTDTLFTPHGATSLVDIGSKDLILCVHVEAFIQC